MSVVGIPNDKINNAAVTAIADAMLRFDGYLVTVGEAKADPHYDGWADGYEDSARVGLLAAVPYIEAEIRAKIAAEIETKVDTIRVAPGDQYALRLANVLDGLRAAACVARGTTGEA